MAEVTPEQHDRVVAFIAQSRFPFPGQTDWPPDSRTLTNRPTPRRAIDAPWGPHHPDIVIVGDDGGVREVAEVETQDRTGWAERWAAGSAASDNRTKTGVKHFFVYVPLGLEDEARAILEEGRISYAGLRAYTIDAAGKVRIIPLVTQGDPKDHVESVSE